MISPLSVSSFPDLSRPSSEPSSMQHIAPASLGGQSSPSIRTRRRLPPQLSLKSTELPRDSRALPTLDLSSSSPLVFRRPSSYASFDYYTHTLDRAPDEEYAPRSGTHRGRLSVSSGMSTSPETASFPPTPQSTKDSIVSLGLARPPNSEANLTLCMGSWIDRTLHIPLPPLPDLKTEDCHTPVSTPIRTRLPDSSRWSLDLSIEQDIEFAKPSPTDSSFSMSPISPIDTSPVKNRFFDVRVKSPSRSEPQTFAAFASPMVLATVNPHIAVTPASPLSALRSTETVSSSSGRSWFRSRGESITSVSDMSTSPSISEDDLHSKSTSQEYSPEPSERFRFLKKMSSQKTILNRRPHLPSIDWDADAEDEMTFAPSSRSASPEPALHSPSNPSTDTSASSYVRTPSPVEHRPDSRTSALSFTHSIDSDYEPTSRSTSPFSYAAAIIPSPAANEAPRRHNRRGSVEVVVATATLSGDIVEARDIEDVIPTLRLLRGPSRPKLW